MLSHLGRGGAAGADAVWAAGGVVLTQAPLTCAAPSMPAAALRTGHVVFVLRPEALAAALVAFCVVTWERPGSSCPPMRSLYLPDWPAARVVTMRHRWAR